MAYKALKDRATLRNTTVAIHYSRGFAPPYPVLVSGQKVQAIIPVFQDSHCGEAPKLKVLQYPI
jgi:hypothetical protein